MLQIYRPYATLRLSPSNTFPPPYVFPFAVTSAISFKVPQNSYHHTLIPSPNLPHLNSTHTFFLHGLSRPLRGHSATTYYPLLLSIFTSGSIWIICIVIPCAVSPVSTIIFTVNREISQTTHSTACQPALGDPEQAPPS
ncbi:hypothetical protein PM082_000145 [Marasmius tenuissimus]|nr:hypothetical protein PM082_000145 [Marasmius tenuissimus]